MKIVELGQESLLEINDDLLDKIVDKFKIKQTILLKLVEIVQ